MKLDLYMYGFKFDLKVYISLTSTSNRYTYFYSSVNTLVELVHSTINNNKSTNTNSTPALQWFINIYVACRLFLGSLRKIMNSNAGMRITLKCWNSHLIDLTITFISAITVMLKCDAENKQKIQTNKKYNNNNNNAGQNKYVYVNKLRRWRD